MVGQTLSYHHTTRLTPSAATLLHSLVPARSMSRYPTSLLDRAKNSKSYVGSTKVLEAQCQPVRVRESGRLESVGRCYWRRCSRKRRQLTRRWICLLTARSPSLLENPLQLVHKYISTYTRRIDRRCRRCPTSSGNSRELANNHNVESNVVLSLFLSLSLSI